jgi:hypothetical protein
MTISSCGAFRHGSVTFPAYFGRHDLSKRIFGEEIRR